MSTTTAELPAAARRNCGDRTAGIEFRAVSKRYGAECVLEDASFTIAPHTCTAVVGRNGAGKTTVIKLLLGLVRPSNGTVTIDGQPPVAAAGSRVGAATDALGLDPELDGFTFLRWLARSVGRDCDWADQVLARVGATRYARKRIGTLSVGMTQRLRLAVALLPDAPYLVLDEPQNGLDPDGIEWLYALLGEELEHGKTVVVATHHLHEAEAVSDHGIVLDRTVRYAGPLDGGLADIYGAFR